MRTNLKTMLKMCIESFDIDTATERIEAYINDAVELKIKENALKDILKPKESNDKKLVDFGNYLLSKKRNVSKINKRSVTDADLRNFEDSRKCTSEAIIDEYNRIFGHSISKNLLINHPTPTRLGVQFLTKKEAENKRL